MSTAYDNYKLVDVAKYLAAVMVIAIHCNELIALPLLDYVLRNIVCRIAVPFFFISNAYFVRRNKQSNPHYLSGYLKNLLKSYLAWSLLFIPIGIDWIHQNLTLANELLPVALLFGLLHVGTYYHLWYIPAMILSLWAVDKLLKKLPYWSVFLLASGLFLFGSLETYYGLLADGWLKAVFDGVIAVLFTTRSGLLYGMIFTLLGFYCWDYQEKLQRLIPRLSKLVLLFGALLVMEGLLLFSVERLDMNFMLVLIPFSFVLFLRILASPKRVTWNTKFLRELSKNYYFLHVICLVVITEAASAFNLPVFSKGIVSFCLVVLLTHGISWVAIRNQDTTINYLQLLLAAALGIGCTLLVGGLVYQWKPDNLILKFEFIPCVWLFSSFCMYRLVTLGKEKQRLAEE